MGLKEIKRWNSVTKLPAHLMSIQINNHCTCHTLYMLKEETQGERDVSVCAEPSPFVAAAVVEAPSHVDCPSPLQGQLSSLHDRQNRLALHYRIWRENWL